MSFLWFCDLSELRSFHFYLRYNFKKSENQTNQGQDNSHLVLISKSPNHTNQGQDNFS